MRKLLYILVPLMAFSKEKNMKKERNDLTGEYSLTGMPEMAAGFKINSDSTFQFYYIYGASDRFAHGTYSSDGKNITLHGSKGLASDFKLEEQKTTGDGMTVSITHENSHLVSGVHVVFFNEHDSIETHSSEEGIATAAIAGCTRIELIHPLFPDMPTVFSVTGPDNFFRFSLMPSLSEVVFDNKVIEYKDHTLLYDNLYLFGRTKASFVKL